MVCAMVRGSARKVRRRWQSQKPSFSCTFTRYPSEASMKCGQNSTTEKSGSFYNPPCYQASCAKVEMLLVRGDACVSDVHKVACLNVKKCIRNQVYLNVVFLLSLLPQFELASNQKTEKSTPRKRNDPFLAPDTCHQCQHVITCIGYPDHGSAVDPPPRNQSAPRGWSASTCCVLSWKAARHFRRSPLSASWRLVPCNDGYSAIILTA